MNISANEEKQCENNPQRADNPKGMYTWHNSVFYLFLDMGMSEVIGILIISERIIKSYYKEVAQNKQYNISETILFEV